MQARPDGRRTSPVFVVAVGLLGALGANGAAAQNQSASVVPTISAEVTWTNNVNLDPDNERRSAFVTQIVPGVNFDIDRPRAQLSGSIRVPILLYTGDVDDYSTVVPHVSLTGSVEAIERFFFVEAAAAVSQQYISPFGARSPSVVNDPENRYTSQSYRLSPYIQGELGGQVDYLLRNDSIWTITSDAPGETSDAYTNVLLGRLVDQPSPFGWGLDYRREDLEFRRTGSQLSEVLRALGLWQPNPEWRLSLWAGYERFEVPRDETSGAIWGVGARWRPGPRTDLDMLWEDRVFGPSWRVAFRHRMARSVWEFDYSRLLTSTPQELAQIPAGGSAAIVLDQLLRSRFPDPAEREAAVQQIILEQGLGGTLTGPFTLFAAQFYFLEQLRGTIGLLGVRNSVFFTAYRVKSTAIAGSEDSPFDLPSNRDNTQYGAGAVWSSRLSSNTTLSVSGDVVRTDANDGPGSTEQGFVRASLSTRISPRTTTYAGLRFLKLRSNVRSDAEEAAVYAGFNHSFR